MAQIVKIPGAYGVDGLEFKRGKCGYSGMGGDCCYTFSQVKQEGSTLRYEGKATAPSTGNNFEWGYRVRQGDVVVEVKMEDTRDNKDFFSGCYPPTAARDAAFHLFVIGLLPCFDRIFGAARL